MQMPSGSPVPMASPASTTSQPQTSSANTERGRAIPLRITSADPVGRHPFAAGDAVHVHHEGFEYRRFLVGAARRAPRSDCSLSMSMILHAALLAPRRPLARHARAASPKAAENILTGNGIVAECPFRVPLHGQQEARAFRRDRLPRGHPAPPLPRPAQVRACSTPWPCNELTCAVACPVSLARAGRPGVSVTGCDGPYCCANESGLVLAVVCQARNVVHRLMQCAA